MTSEANLTAISFDKQGENEVYRLEEQIMGARISVFQVYMEDSRLFLKGGAYNEF